MSDTPELRTDPITGHQVIIAMRRGNRPGAYREAANPQGANSTSAGTPCPFCPGNENQTPPAVLIRPAMQNSAEVAQPASSWSLRVVPNLYPATTLDLSALDESAKMETSGLFSSQPNDGLHEVVIETDQHFTQFTDVAPDAAEQVFLSYAQRFRGWQTESHVRFGLAFKNNGYAAGASIDHVHSQLIGLNTLPAALMNEWNRASSFFEQHQKCVFCELAKKEMSADTRIVDADDEFVVVCPFASRLPYEMWIIPRTHASHFDRANDAQIRAAGRKAHAMLTRLTKLIENVPYNYLIHTAPFDTPATPHYHWHIEVIPRITRWGGFEWATGCQINSISPEQAASQLRSV